jgi:predicted Zn-dependent peptidase
VGNAVLVVAGDIDVAEATRLIEANFSDVPARPAPARPDFTEPDLTAERSESYTDPLAPLPAIAAGWRVPDPIADLDGYLPYAVLAEVLTDGDAARLVERLVLRDRLVTSIGGYISFMGEPFAVRDPTALLLQAHLPPGGDPAKVLRVVDEECDRIATDGLAPGELVRTQARMAANLLRDTDAVLGRALQMAVLEQQRGAAELLGQLPGMVAGVTEEAVVAAAATLVPARRATVEVVPGGTR